MRRAFASVLLFLLAALCHCKSWGTFWDAQDKTAPSKISFGSQSLIKLIPGVQVNFMPNITGNVKTWTLTPTLPAGLSFNTSTGAISGAPTVSPFALTTYTLTASNEFGSASYVFQLSILASGDNVWTVFVGVASAETVATPGSLIYDLNTKSLIVGGNSAGNLHGQISTSAPQPSSFIAKYSTAGEHQYTRLLGAPGDYTNSAGVRLDAASNIYMAGSTKVSLPDTTIAPCITAAFLSKYDSAGTRQWTKLHCTSSETLGNALAVDSQGTVFLTGYVAAASVHEFTNNAWTDDGLFLAKYDTAGNRIYTRGISDSTSNNRRLQAYAITFDHLGFLWPAGMSQVTAYCGTSGSTTKFPVIVKFSSDTLNTGYIAASCANVTSTGNNTFTFGAISDSTGNIYTVGYTNGTLDGIPLTGTEDGYFIKFNNSSVKQYTAKIGVAGAATRAYSITRSEDDNYYVTGYTTGNLNGQIKTGVQDVFVAKYSSAGVLQWTKLLGTAAATMAGYALAFDSNNTIYVAATSNRDYDGVTNPAAPGNNAVMVTRFVR